MAGLLAWAGPATAGGGVMLASDSCIVSIGFYTAHLTVYQPRTRGDEEFCRSYPDLGETVFVLDYLHDSLKDVPVELRIIENATGLGSYAALADVQALGDLAPLTVFHRPPTVEPGASYQVSHVFERAGDFLAILTAGHPTSDKTFTAVVPFSVGVGGFPVLWLVVGLVVLAGAALAYFWLRPQGSRTHRVAA